MAKYQNIEFFRGDDITLKLYVLKEDGTQWENISGWTLAFTVEDAAGAVIVSKTTGSGIVIGQDAALAWFATITVEDTDTDADAPGVYVYDVKRTNAGAESVLVRGNLNLLQGITA